MATLAVMAMMAAKEEGLARVVAKAAVEPVSWDNTSAASRAFVCRGAAGRVRRIARVTSRIAWLVKSATYRAPPSGAIAIPRGLPNNALTPVPSA